MYRKKIAFIIALSILTYILTLAIAFYAIFIGVSALAFLYFIPPYLIFLYFFACVLYDTINSREK
jgi:hypothetical protein